MARVTLLLAVLLSGCTSSTRLIDTTGPIGVADAQQALAGRTVVVELAAGMREGGRLVYVRADSTAWDAGGVLRTVPTASIVSVEILQQGPPPGTLTGVAIGGAAGIAVLAAGAGGDQGLAVGALELFAVTVGTVVGVVAVPIAVALARRPTRFVWATGD